jgi:hypothetical protein
MLYKNFKNILNLPPYIRCIREKQGGKTIITRNTRRMANPPGEMAKPPREMTNPLREMANSSRELTNPPRELIIPPVFLAISPGDRREEWSIKDFQHLNYKYI